MVQYIGCGKLSSLYFYILYSLASKCLSNIILGLNKVISVSSYSSIFQINPVLNNHILIKSLYKYIGFMIFGVAFYFYAQKKNARTSNNDDNNNNTNNNTDNNGNNINHLIYRRNTVHTTINTLHFILCCLLSVFYVESIEITYYLGFYDLDLWVFNIVFTSLFMRILLKTQMFTHQIFSLSSIFFINLILIITKSFFNKDNKENVYIVTEELLGNQFYSFFIYFFYIFNSFLISYVRVYLKVLMDLHYISLHKIIFIIGSIGFLLVLICLIFTSIFSCDENYENDSHKFCKINENETNNYYFDSIPLYFKGFKTKNEEENHIGKNLVEIFLITPLKIFANFLEFNFEISLIYYLNPIYILVSDSLYYGFLRLLSFILSLNDSFDVKLFLSLIADILALISYSIYLEVIELRFCGLNDNTRISIINRGIRDVNGIINENESNVDEGVEVEVEEEEE